MSSYMFAKLPLLVLLVVIIGACGSGQEVKSLIGQLESPDPDLRYNAVMALGKIGPEPAVVRAVIDALSDPDTAVRLGAIRILENFGDNARMATPALKKTLKDDNEFVRDGAVHALGKIGLPSEVIPEITNMLNDSSMYVRIAAARVLGQFGPEASEALPELRDLAKNDHEQLVRNEAKESINEIEG
jgi:HEAT repeat protein